MSAWFAGDEVVFGRQAIKGATAGWMPELESARFQVASDRLEASEEREIVGDHR